MVARFTVLGLTALPGSPADFRKRIAEDTDKWAKVIEVEVLGLRPLTLGRLQSRQRD